MSKAPREFPHSPIVTAKRDSQAPDARPSTFAAPKTVFSPICTAVTMVDILNAYTLAKVSIFV